MTGGIKLNLSTDEGATVNHLAPAPHDRSERHFKYNAEHRPWSMQPASAPIGF